MATVPHIETLDDAGNKEFGRAYRRGVPPHVLKELTTILIVDTAIRKAKDEELICPLLVEWMRRR
jgi:hypothetical protein